MRIAGAVVRPRYSFVKLRTRALYGHMYLHEAVHVADNQVLRAWTSKGREPGPQVYDVIRQLNDAEIVHAEEGYTIEGEAITLTAQDARQPASNR